MNLAGKNIVVYDLEIKKNPEECTDGWKSYGEFGISVACAYDYRDGRFRVFMDDNLIVLAARLNEPDTLIVGFNHIRFDNAVLRATGYPLKPDSELKNYDMLKISRAGAKVNEFSKGFKLDEHLKALNLPLKTANGAIAPKLFQDKQFGELTDYCMNDVTQEKALFEWICQTGVLACGHNNSAFYKIERAAI